MNWHDFAKKMVCLPGLRGGFDRGDFEVFYISKLLLHQESFWYISKLNPCEKSGFHFVPEAMTEEQSLETTLESLPDMGKGHYMIVPHNGEVVLTLSCVRRIHDREEFHRNRKFKQE